MSKFKRMLRTIMVCMLAVFCSLSVVSGSFTNFTNVYAEEEDKSTEDDQSKWIKVSDDTWIYKFNVTDATRQYYYWEETYPGYKTDYTATNPGTIVNKEGTVTNTLNSIEPVELGKLKVGKTVSEESDASFVFTITLTDENSDALSGINTYSGVMFKNGVAKITLKKDQNRVIAIPSGYHYTITEEPAAGFTSSVSSGSATGTIVAEQTTEVTFHNVADPVPLGSFKLRKKVSGNVVDPNAEYHFYVSFMGLKGLTAYTISDTGDTFTADANGNATVNVSLKADEEVEFINLPINTTYQVTEQAGPYVSSFKLTDAGGVNAFVKARDEATTENTSLSTAAETLDANEEVTVEFTNTTNVTTDLIIGKTVINPPANGDATRFEFTVNLSGLRPNASYNSDIGRIMADDNGECEKTFYLGNGETITLIDLPVGITYEVTESASAYKASYAITGGGTGTGENANVNIPLSTGPQTLNEAESTIVQFSNDVQRSTLSLKKEVVDGETADNNRDYEFTITLRNGSDTTESRATPLSGTFNYTKGAETGQVTFDTAGKATVTLKHNQTIVIDGIPVGAQYEIEEADYTENDIRGVCENPTGLIVPAGASVVYQNLVERKAPVTITKTVRGNLGNRYEDFNMEILITNPNGKNVAGEYTYSGTVGGEAVTDGTFTVGNDGKGRIALRHGDSITFDVYIGSVVTVTEDDYSGEGYVVTYTNNGMTVAKSASSNNIRVVNTNGSIIPTGVLPMVGGGSLMLIGLAILAYINRKRLLELAENVIFVSKP